MKQIQSWKKRDSMDFATTPLPRNTLRGKARYRGWVVPKGEPKYTADIAREMVDGGWCTLRQDAVEHVLGCLADYMKESIRRDGCRRTINGLVSFYPSVEGEFETPNSPFDPAKHKFVLRATATRDFAAALAKSVRSGNNVTERPDEAIVAIGCEASPRGRTKPAKGPVPIVARSVVTIAGKGLLPVAGRDDEGVFLYSLDKKRKLAEFEVLEGSNATVLKVRLATLLPRSGMRCQVCVQTRGGGDALRKLFRRVTYYIE